MFSFPHIGRFAAILGMAAAVFVSSVASATTYYVDASASTSGNGFSWSTAKQTIQEALDLATPGSVDEIRCADGVYKPANQSSSIELKNGVRIKGGYIGPNSLSIDPETRDPAVYVSVISGDIASDDNAQIGSI